MIDNLTGSTDTALIERERAECYRLLSACFYPPLELQGIEELFSRLTRLLERLCPDAAGFSGKLQGAFAAEHLSVDYAQLFVGPFELKAAPYGSVYLDGERRVMGDSTLKVIGMYREAGLSVDEGFKDMPDHIAAELEFMHYLASADDEAGGPAAGIVPSPVNTQKQFMRELLGPWVPAFCEQIRRGALSTFYRDLAGCLDRFIHCDSKHLELGGQGDIEGGAV